MPTTTRRRKAARPKPDALTLKTATERQRLKRLLIARRDILATVDKLRRANDRVNAKMLELAKDIAQDHGGEVVIAPAVPLREPLTGTGG